MGATSKWKAPPGWRKTRELVFARDGRRCYRCGGYATTVDHRVPVALGGTHALSNLRPACPGCNSSTGASMGNRIGQPRGYMRRGRKRAPATRPAATAPAPLRTSRDW